MDERLTILVVEDDPVYAEFVASTLRETGHHVDGVTTGAAARDQVGRRVPDAIILDLGLPDGSGYDIAKTLRDVLPASTVIIVLTATQYPELDLAQAVGVDLVLTKPVEPALVSGIVDHVRSRRARKLER